MREAAANRGKKGKQAHNRQQFRAACQAFFHQLRDQQRIGIEHKARDCGDGEQNNHRAADQSGWDFRKGLAAGLDAFRIKRRFAPVEEPRNNAGNAGDDEGPAPAGIGGDEGSQHRRGGHTQIAENAIDPHGAAHFGACRFHQNGCADWVINRDESPHGAKRDGQHQR